jgi:putative endonuclease
VTFLRRDSNHQRGAAAEQRARSHLESHGLTLLAHNYRCRMGEIDLIMRDGDVFVFVEVRLRGRGALVDAAESIDARKQARVIACARHYLMGKPEAPCRFDCVLMDSLEAANITWLRNAFTL